MGALPATLFLLSVWHFRWTRPRFSLCSSSLITMYIILLSAPQMHTRIYSLLSLSSLNMYMHPSHLLVILPAIVIIVFSKGENQYLFSQGNDSFFLAFSLYLFILAEWLYSSHHPLSPSVFVFSDLLFLRIFLPFLFSFAASFSTRTRVCVAKIQPWGYIASFLWGPVVTLKARYVVCRFASALLSLSALRTLVCAWLSTQSLLGSTLVGKEQHACTCWL